jgi:hypothetical protein
LEDVSLDPSRSPGERVIETRRGSAVLSLPEVPAEFLDIARAKRHAELLPRGGLEGRRGVIEVLLAAAINSTVVAGENPTVGSTVWLPAESVAPGR